MYIWSDLNIYIGKDCGNSFEKYENNLKLMEINPNKMN